MTSKTRRPRIRSAFASWSVSQLHQVGLGLRTLLGGDSELAGARKPIQRGDDRPGLGEVDPTRGHRRGEHLMALEALRQPEVGAGLAAYLPGLDRDPVRRAAGAGVDRGLRPFGVGEQPQRERVQLCSTSREGDQSRPLVLGSHRHQRRIGQRVETRNEPLGEVEHRVEVLDRLAAHE